MSDPQDQMRQAVRELTQELSCSAEHATRVVRQAIDDAQRFVAQRGHRAPPPPPPPPGRSPVELIRELGALRDDGLISEEEFQAKKRDLLERL